MGGFCADEEGSVSLGLGAWLCFSGLPQGSSHRRGGSHSPFPLASPVIASHSWAGGGLEGAHLVGRCLLGVEPGALSWGLPQRGLRRRQYSQDPLTLGLGGWTMVFRADPRFQDASLGSSVHGCLLCEPLARCCPCRVRRPPGMSASSLPLPQKALTAGP